MRRGSKPGRGRRGRWARRTGRRGGAVPPRRAASSAGAFLRGCHGAEMTPVRVRVSVPLRLRVSHRSQGPSPRQLPGPLPGQQGVIHVWQHPHSTDLPEVKFNLRVRASHHLLLPRCCWDLTCHRLRMAQRARWRQGHHPTALTGQDVHCPHQPQKALSPPAVDLGFPRCCPKVTARKRTRQLGELTATKAHGRGTGLRST